MSIGDYIRPECVLLNMKAQNKHDVFVELATCLENGNMLDQAGCELLVRKLEEREKLSTTGVGESIAIPHASLEGFSETVILVGILPKGIDFAAVDNQPVKVVFMIVGSQAVPRLHIQILARIVRLCRNKDLIKKVQNASTPQEVLEAIRLVDN